MADIVIRGMEMPKNCFLCRFFRDVQDYDGTFGCCVAANKEINLKFDGCPLVPLPAGHGRLGDLDVLEHEISESIDNYWNGGDNGYYLAEDALMEIRCAPTIVPAEGGPDE